LISSGNDDLYLRINKRMKP